MTSPDDRPVGTPGSLRGRNFKRASDAEVLRERIAAELLRARERTHGLTECVDDADLVRQHSRLMSPLVWDMAHVGNQEEVWLLRAVGGREPLHPEIDPLYDAFEHPRAERPSLPLLPPAEARAYLRQVRGRVLDVLEHAPMAGAPLVTDGFVFGMIAQHEQQHDETMLVTHQLREGPPVLHAEPPVATPPGVAPPLGTPSVLDAPAGSPVLDAPAGSPVQYAAAAGSPVPHLPPDAGTLPAEVFVPSGLFTMGTSAEPWALDNERPAHTVDVASYFIDVTPVTNAAYSEFIDDGGYDDPRWWSAAGWEHRRRAGLTTPLFWRREGGQWIRRRFGVMEPVPPTEPVMHVCWYEAEAYARWAGRRLPTEAEWEKAARWDPASGRSRRYPWGDGEPTAEHANLGQRHLQPAQAGSYPAGQAPCGARQLLGDVWEWTASSFLPYPGFTAWPYREYSEVFFGSTYKVLRGGSFAVHPVACRATFRNWDYPIRRQIFAGFRTARDAGVTESA